MNNFLNIIYNTRFVSIKETFQGDASFVHTKHVFDRKKNDDNHF